MLRIYLLNRKDIFAGWKTLFKRETGDMDYREFKDEIVNAFEIELDDPRSVYDISDMQIM